MIKFNRPFSSIVSEDIFRDTIFANNLFLKKNNNNSSNVVEYYFHFKSLGIMVNNNQNVLIAPFVSRNDLAMSNATL